MAMEGGTDLPQRPILSPLRRRARGRTRGVGALTKELRFSRSPAHGSGQ